MVVRAASGEVRVYPAVETFHKHNLVLAPFRSPNSMLGPRAQTIAYNAVRTLSGVGMFGVELSPIGDGTGSYAVDPGATSQYEKHLRAILDLPSGSTELVAPPWACSTTSALSTP
ncbi:hypothetical protein EV122DRAFT_282398 [Schizophyllum commune]